VQNRRGPGKKSLFPGFIPPALASDLVGKPPRGDAWIHEIKFDGYRVQLHIANESTQVFTRRGHDWTSRFRKIAADAFFIKANSAIIDGEVIVQAADGTSDFAVLQKELRSARHSDRIVMYAFDLLFLNGHDLRQLPLVQRKDLLRKLVAGSHVLYSESFEEEGAQLLKSACAMGLEGIVSKRRTSPYRSERTTDWIKVTCRQRETLRIAGYGIKGSRFDGLYLGRAEGGDLVYAGKVGHGFDQESEQDLQHRLNSLKQRVCPYTLPIRKANAVWVRPDLLARAKSAEGKVRHPVFKGLRNDI
jgi:bifunctional non-homologous end joining protein LigD